MSTTPTFFEAQYQPPRGTSVTAILGLILGIIPCSFLLGLLFSIIGIAATGPTGKKGRAVAITGLVFSLLWAGVAGSIWYTIFQFNQKIGVIVDQMAAGDVSSFWKDIPNHVKGNVTEKEFAERVKALVAPYGKFQQVDWLTYKMVTPQPGSNQLIVSVDLVFANKTVPFALHAKGDVNEKVTLDGKNVDEALGIPIHALFGPQPTSQPGISPLPGTQPAWE